MAHKYQGLEICVTDFCNLRCALCAQGTPHQKNKKIMSLKELERISKFFKPYEFQFIKISGGEPTSHPHFSEICRNINRMFPAKQYVLATNGFKLEGFLDDISIFTEIDLSRYPGFNDEVYERLIKLNIPNINAVVKEDKSEDGMQDVYVESNSNKEHIWGNCPYTYITKVVQGRIHPCCVVFGLAILRNIDTNTAGVLLDKDWRTNIEKIDMKPFCRRCWVDVDVTPKYIKNLVSRISSNISRIIRS